MIILNQGGLVAQASHIVTKAEEAEEVEMGEVEAEEVEEEERHLQL